MRRCFVAKEEKICGDRWNYNLKTRCAIDLRFMLTIAAKIAVFLAAIFLLNPVDVRAEGHFLPGVSSVREFAAPPKGWIYQQYNVFYTSDNFKDRNGDTARSERGEFDLEVDSISIVPTLYYISEIELLGANLGFALAPSFGSTAVNAAISNGELGREIDDDNFGLGDLYVQPLWMSWQLEQMDLSLLYAFYAPIGDFDVDANDNVGLGYWSNQFQATGLFYLDEAKATAISLVGTFEINGEQEDSDYQPGNNVALEWGVSQFVSEQLEVGLAGYHYFQVSDDKGVPDSLRPGRERVHGIGGQATYYPAENAGLVFRFLTEVEARSRFEANLFSLTGFWVF